MTKIKSGDIARVEYTGTLEDGTVFDSTENKGPIEFKIDEGQVIKGFNDGINGMTVGEEKELTIKAADGYGEKKEDLVKTLPRSALAGDMEIKNGMVIQLKNPKTDQIGFATVVEVNEEKIVLDLNHPLAGKNLKFKVKLLEIK